MSKAVVTHAPAGLRQASLTPGQESSAELQLLRSHRRKGSPKAWSHPVNIVHHSEATIGERLADQLAAAIGSWPFLIGQSAIVLVWVSVNVFGLVHRWDPYPFILLNLMFSVQAAYAGPLILLAGNRQGQKDRLTLEHADWEGVQTRSRTLTILEEIRGNTDLTVKILKRVGQARNGGVRATGQRIRST